MRTTRLIMVILLAALTTANCDAGTTTLAVSATVLSNHKCTFNTPGPLTLAFGALDPLAPADVTRQATIDFECKGNKNIAVSYLVSDDDGSNEGGANLNRMKHIDPSLVGPDAHIPYSFTMSPTSGTVALKTPVTLTITGVVYGADYQMAYAGNYSDTVTITLNP